MKNISRRTKMQALLSLAFFILLVFSPSAFSGGVTIITHGWGGGTTSWVGAMGDEIRSRIFDVVESTEGRTLSTDEQIHLTARYILKIANSEDSLSGFESQNIGSFNGIYWGIQQISNVSMADSVSGETIILLNWSDFDIASNYFSTTYVAQIASHALFDSRVASIFGGEPVSVPIHLIGHSRGGSLVGALAEDLAKHNIWVDQVTFLDPHPIIIPPVLGYNPANDWGENDGMHVPDNVRFADNYWQEYLWDFEPDGEFVIGAYNKDVWHDVLVGEGYGSEHSDVHLWYHGTIDDVGYFTDNSELLTESEAAEWYSTVIGMPGPRYRTGYYYSRIVGGTRPDAAYGGVAHVNTRPYITYRVDPQWANLDAPIKFSGSVVEIGASIPVTYRYQSTGPCIISFGFDLDQNPHNSSSIYYSTPIDLPATSDGREFDNGSLQAYSLDTSSISPGDYYIIAKIIANGKVRYVHSARQVKLLGYVNNNVPESPTNLNANTISSARVDLAWDDNSDNEDGFKIYRSVLPASGYVEIDTVGLGVESYVSDGLAGGKRYYYRVYAYNANGISYSYAYANAVTDGGVPEFTASDGDYSDRVLLQWPAYGSSGSLDVYGYSLYRDGQAIVSFPNLLNPATTSYEDTNVEPGVTYSYTLGVDRSEGGVLPGTHQTTFYSDTGYALPNIDPLPAPAYLWAADGLDGQYVDIIWGAVDGASDYRIYRSETANLSDASSIWFNKQPDMTDGEGNVVTWRASDINASPGVIYNYWICAVKNIGETVIEGDFVGPESGYLISEDVYEPDNQYDIATSIEIDSPGQIHSLDLWSDVDWLIFNVTEPMGIDIIADMFGRDYTGLTIELYGPDSYSSYIAGVESWYSPGTVLTISRKGSNALSPGTYYIKCRTKTNVYYAPGLYLLKIIGYPINDIPTAIAPAILTEIPENGFALITLSGSDPETSVDKLTYKVYAPPTHGTVSINGNQAVYIPSPNYYGVDSFEFSVTDMGDGSSPALTSAPATVDINVFQWSVAELSGDSIVNLKDFAILANQWQRTGAYSGDIAPVPNGDGIVDILDLVEFVEDWLVSSIDSSSSDTSVKFFSEELNSDPGWNTEGEWQFGIPLGQGGTYGNPDPTSGYTGNNVYGINLGGNCSVTGGVEIVRYLTSSAIDCTDYSNVKLKYDRWMNMPEPMIAPVSVEISNDNVNWNPVWINDAGDNYKGMIFDSDWVNIEHDISQYADNQSTVYVRWGYSVYSDLYPESGWNIDDVQFWGIQN